MKFEIILDAYDFDGTHTVHQVSENDLREVSKIITEKLLQTNKFQDILKADGGSVKMVIELHGPDMNKEDTKEYNINMKHNFNVQDVEVIVVVVKKKSNFNPDKLTKTEISYLPDMIARVPYQVMADNRYKGIETVRTHVKNVKFKSKCKDSYTLAIYAKKEGLLG